MGEPLEPGRPDRDKRDASSGGGETVLYSTRKTDHDLGHLQIKYAAV